MRINNSTMNDILSAIQRVPAERQKVEAKKAKALFDISSFPSHLSVPEGALTVDLRQAIQLSGLSLTPSLITFTVPVGMIFRWKSYSLFADVASGITCVWDIKVNGNRAFIYHGNPYNSNAIDLALGPDLAGEIDANRDCKTGDVITIAATVSSSTGNPTVGARIRGWCIPSNDQQIARVNA